MTDADVNALYAKYVKAKEAVGEKQPDLLLLNDGDHTYAKIRLDERSLATVIGGLSKLK